MSLADRREALKLAIGCALMPVFASHARAATITANTIPAGPAITPPDGMMIYRRTMLRELPGGASLEVARDFTVRFERLGEGFRLTGSQRTARVTAPENLASLARLEEQRVETGIFPLVLNANGHILEGAGTDPSEEVRLALENVQRRFAGRGAEAGELIEALQATSAQLTATLPFDLFCPNHPSRTESQQITLPWGDSGEVTTRFEAERDPQTGLMRNASREVVTRLGGEQRRSLESWALMAA